MVSRVPGNLREDNASNEWQQIEAGIFQSMSSPRRAAHNLVLFLREVRDKMGITINSESEPAAESVPLAQFQELQASVADLTAQVASLKETIESLTAPVNANPETDATPAATDAAVVPATGTTATEVI